MKKQETENLRAILIKGGKDLGLAFPDTFIEKLLVYLNEIFLINKKFNLTGHKTKQDIVTHHFIDTFSLIPFIKNHLTELKRTAHWSGIDIGPGAGFPGIIIKLYYPDSKITLIEATRKYVVFLTRIISILKLKDIELIHARSEEYTEMKEYSGNYDFAFGRAVAKLPELLKYTLPFLRKEGVLLAQKGRDAKKEIEDSKETLEKLGGQVEKVYKIRGISKERHIVSINKLS